VIVAMYNVIEITRATSCGSYCYQSCYSR